MRTLEILAVQEMWPNWKVRSHRDSYFESLDSFNLRPLAFVSGTDVRNSKL